MKGLFRCYRCGTSVSIYNGKVMEPWHEPHRKHSCSYVSTTEQYCRCELCFEITPMLSTRRCDRCWELETRIRSDPELARKIIEALR